MYYQIFDLIVQYIYGSPEVLTSYQELVCTNVSTFMCLVVLMVPFLACLYVCRWFFR